jgi:hypothetical protein
MSIIHHYNKDLSSGLSESGRTDGPFRILELDGRKGINPTSIHTLIQYPAHNLNEAKGSLSYWVFALEEIFTFSRRDIMFTELNKGPHLFTLLSDNPNLGNFSDAAFLLTYEAAWHPAFLAKFYKGDVFLDAIRAPQKAYAMASAFEMHRNRWYQFTLTWDFEKGEIFIYANGVRVASSDRLHTAFWRDRTGDSLYSGKPVFCFGEMKFHDNVLGPEEVAALYETDAIETDAAFQADLRRVYAGENPEPFNFEPEDDWNTRLQLSLEDPGHLEKFRIQGIAPVVEITEEGLHIKTLPEPYEPDNRGKQMYLWTRDRFEGDLYVEFEFRPNQDFGLSVLVLQASGMTREDLEQDYPLRTTGNMHWIHSSDMRNYHLEYFRHMTAVRNDFDNAALVKNPYQMPLGFACLAAKLEIGEWHRLQVLQEGTDITVAIDGRRCFTASDRPFGNNGPVLNCGRIAIRCMINTDMHFRNLVVANRTLPYREIQHAGL